MLFSRFLLASLIATAPLAAQKLQPLFDGESIDGWTVRNGTARYVVVDGAILGTTAVGSPNSFLSPPKDYADFVLEFEVKVDPRMNSGVQIRSHEYPEETKTWINNRGRRERTFPKGRVHGYQVEISNESNGTSGGIYDEARRGWVANIAENNPACSKAFRDKQWNLYRVEARGDRIRTWLNGEACADLVDPADLSGFLGFQVHSFREEPPAEVRWRNIRIADLGRHVWKPIFDGKTLNGWEKRGGGEVSVANGVIQAAAKQGEPSGFLVSEAAFDDFTVRLRYKSMSGNGGFFFRAVELGKGRIEGNRGFEVEIDPTRDAGGLQEPGERGWIEHTGPVAETPFYRDNDWNELVVHARGGRIVVHVNGEKTAELFDDKGRKSGKLALQLNARQAPVEMEYKDLAILVKE